MRLTWAVAAPRVALLDLATGLRGQAVTVLLNEQPIGRLALAEVRGRYRLELPAERQRAGDNTLAFRFDRAAPATGLGGRRVAAAFYSLAVGAEGDPGLEDLLAKDAPALASVTRAGSLVQVGPSILRYSLRLPPDAELRFVQDWLGHANIQNTVIYTFLASAQREQKARKVFLKLPRF